MFSQVSVSHFGVVSLIPCPFWWFEDLWYQVHFREWSGYLWSLLGDGYVKGVGYVWGGYVWDVGGYVEGMDNGIWLASGRHASHWNAFLSCTYLGIYIVHFSSGSSGRVGGAEKHEIYAAAFGSHLFYELFSQGQGGPWPPRPPPWIRYCI